MAVFPRVQSPCPYKARLSTIMEGDYCRACQRSVVDLTAMTDDGRRAFMAGCVEDVCVSYRIRPVAAAAAAAAAVMVPTAAAAQDGDIAYIILGGITDPANTEFVDEAELAEVPELPVVYDDDGSRGDKSPAINSR